MCCLCGAVVTKRAGYRIIDPTVHVQNSSALYVRQQNKQAMILDIDNTILVSRKHTTDNASEHAEHWVTNNLDLDVIWRKGIVHDLCKVTDAGVVLYIHTKGVRVYADEVRRRINERAGRSIIDAANVMSRDEERGFGKSLTHFFNASDPQVVAMDDRVDVWGNDALYVLQVPALEWSTEDDEGLHDQIDLALRAFEDGRRHVDTTFADTLRRVIHDQDLERIPDEDDIAELHQAINEKHIRK
jgi:hypothetical protein